MKHFLLQPMLLATLLAWGVGSLVAQDALSREDAVARAMQRNYGLRLVRLQAEQAAVNNGWGAAGALPRVSLSATPSSSVSDQRENPTSFLQERIQSSALNVGGQVA